MLPSRNVVRHIRRQDDDLFSFQWPDGVPRTANHPVECSARTEQSALITVGDDSETVWADVFLSSRREMEHDGANGERRFSSVRLWFETPYS